MSAEKGQMNPQSFHIHSQFLRQFSTPVVSVQSFHTQTITFTLKRSHEQNGIATCTPPPPDTALCRFAAGSTLGPIARTRSANNRPSTLASLIVEVQQRRRLAWLARRWGQL